MLQHSDGFDSHATGSPTLSDGNPGWTGQTGVTVQAADGKFSGKSLRAPAGVTSYAQFTLPTNGAVAFYARVATLGGSWVFPLLRSAAAVNHLTVDQLGVLRVYDGAGTLRITSAAGVLPQTEYHWVEVSWRSDGIYLSVDSMPIGSYIGVYTAPATALRILNGGSGLPAVDLDDLLVWDNSGTFFNVYALTPRRIQLQRPTANGDVVQWSPNGATNWQSVDDTDWTGGAGVQSTAGAQKDLYQLSALATTPATVDAVVVRTKVENTGDNPASLQHVLRNSSDSEIASEAQAVPFSTTVLQSVFYRDPALVPWTGDSITGLQAGQASVNA